MDHPAQVLVTGSIAGFIPGCFQAVYNGSKAFIDNFTDALRNEIKLAVANATPAAVLAEPGTARDR